MLLLPVSYPHGIVWLGCVQMQEKGYYEFQYVFNRKSYDSYFGSKTASNDVISWSYSFDTEPNVEKE